MCCVPGENLGTSNKENSVILNRPYIIYNRLVTRSLLFTFGLIYRHAQLAAIIHFKYAHKYEKSDFSRSVLIIRFCLRSRWGEVVPWKTSYNQSLLYQMRRKFYKNLFVGWSHRFSRFDCSVVSSTKKFYRDFLYLF